MGDVNHPIAHSAARNKVSQSLPPHESEAAFEVGNITSSQQRIDSALAKCGISPTYPLPYPHATQNTSVPTTSHPTVLSPLTP